MDEDRRRIPGITAAVCTHNRASLAIDCVKALRRQMPLTQALHVLVVDNGDDDSQSSELHGALGSAAGVELIRSYPPGLARARNEAVHLCKTLYVAFIDDDALPCAEWLASIVDTFSATGAAAVAGPISLIWPQSGCPDWLLPEHLGLLGQLDLGSVDRWLSETEFAFGTNMAFDVSALNKVGGFNTTLGRVGAQHLLSMEEIGVQQALRRIGLGIRFNHRGQVFHRVHDNRLSRNWFRSRTAWQAVSEALSEHSRASLDWRVSELLRLATDLQITDLLPRLFCAESRRQFSVQREFLFRFTELLLNATSESDDKLESQLAAEARALGPKE